jgi:arylsulfatase
MTQSGTHEDLYLTLATAAGLNGVKDKLLNGLKIGDMNYKVHLDGYDNTALWTGQSDKSARREFFYYDETDLMALRPKADMPKNAIDVAIGGRADMPLCTANVRF